MRVLIQHTLLEPTDWIEIDSKDWAALPKRPLPDGTHAVDDARGYLHQLCIQGLVMAADHYAVEHVDEETVRATIWNDHPPDYPVGKRFVQVWTFRTLAPDPVFNGAWNTRQSQVLYVDPGGEVATFWLASGTPENTTVRAYDDFVPPDESLIRHGLMVTDELNERHYEATGLRRWREWTEGVPGEEIITRYRGQSIRPRVRDQRALGRFNKPDGTRTYFARDNVLSRSWVNANNELTFELGTAAAGDITSINLSGGSGTNVALWTTPANEPNSDAWPTGNYRQQLDCTSVGAAITYGLLDVLSITPDGGFYRVNAAGTSALEGPKVQSIGAFSGPGLKLAETGSVSWSSGSATDVFATVVCAARPANHGNQSITFEVNETDDFADGPWPAADGRRIFIT